MMDVSSAPRILVVDDDQLVLESIHDVIETAHDVTATTSPREALRLLASGRHHIMMTDLMMDEMPGIELIRAAREIHPELVTVVMTGFGSKEAAIAAVREGAYDFLEKPLTPAIILQAVDRAWQTVQTEMVNRRLLRQLTDKNARLEEEMAARRRIEMELVQTQKLEAVGQLAAGIAHEINTPMQFIGDNLRFLRDNFDEILTTGDGDDRPDVLTSGFLREEIPRAINESLEGVQRLATIVQAMRNFSHPGTDTRESVDINQMIQSTLTVARNEWKYVAELQLTLDESLPLVQCYPGEINQALLNVILNAAQAVAASVDSNLGERGKITVASRGIDGWCEIRITDTGHGIPAEIRDHIFDPFFTTKPVGQGTGQGLAITQSIIVQKHGGKIHLDCEEGRTTFTINLPVEDEGGDTPTGARS